MPKDKAAFDYPELYASIFYGKWTSESTIRRRAVQRGYLIRKSRRVNLTPFDQGGYMLIEIGTDTIVVGPRFDANILDILVHLRDASDYGAA
ncbi:hypothetical protein [Mesorhizobium sp. NZP2077]|uniref:hypothetical protein n=1 Tax=Mesorhizobium sp. NZP2077 TaxID=2483404 RepID=UPI0015578B60|nr:hypothetical protein [Mesorhizobium sp. NZP2077]QKD19400.1 hypothetical protein HGP13_32930 [Mesorhizobium sp. NZP2077]